MGENIVIMDCIKFQKLRTNDVINDAGKQFELGISWNNFFGFKDTDPKVSVTLIFKALLTEHLPLNDKQLNLVLGEVTKRGDRKAYSGGKSLSEIKDFFINQLQLSNNNVINKDYFAVLKSDDGNYYLYFVPNFQYENFIEKLSKSDIKIDTVDVDKQNISKSNNKDDDYPRNRIIFGAPGTGKSFLINKECIELLKKYGVGDENYERVTFHPDYSYANFVGTYKPVMVENPSHHSVDDNTREVLEILNDKNKDAQAKYDSIYETCKSHGVKDATRIPTLLGIIGIGENTFVGKMQDGTEAGTKSTDSTEVFRKHGVALGKYVQLKSTETKTSEISYKYVPGPFMRIYAKALENTMDVENGTDNWKPFILIIEEINRANVAAVFGDIFQLLDRKNNVSEYSIQASEDIKKYLAEKLGGDLEDYAKIKIPDNLFIWATMNSADQGVFPMDTAFKRRWDFTYLGIDNNEKELENKFVLIGKEEPKYVEWNSLRKAINEFLATEKINEDKQLGPYFIAKDIVVPTSSNEIDKNKFNDVFKHKVLMYLFDDAAKQKRSKLFEGIQLESSRYRYSKICEAFEEKGIAIFNSSIRESVTSLNNIPGAKDPNLVSRTEDWKESDE